MASATYATAVAKGGRQTPNIAPVGRHNNSRRAGRHTGRKSSITWRLRHSITGTPRMENPTIRNGCYPSTVNPADRRRRAPRYRQKHPQSVRYAAMDRLDGRTTGWKAGHAPPAPGTMAWAHSRPHNRRGDRDNKIRDTVRDPQQGHRGYPGVAC